MKTLDLTPDQQNALLTLIDIAVKAGGLNVAGAAIELAKLIQEATEKESSLLPTTNLTK